MRGEKEKRFSSLDKRVETILRKIAKNFTLSMIDFFHRLDKDKTLLLKLRDHYEKMRKYIEMYWTEKYNTFDFVIVSATIYSAFTRLLNELYAYFPLDHYSQRSWYPLISEFTKMILLLDKEFSIPEIEKLNTDLIDLYRSNEEELEYFYYFRLFNDFTVHLQNEVKKLIQKEENFFDFSYLKEIKNIFIDKLGAIFTPREIVEFTVKSVVEQIPKIYKVTVDSDDVNFFEPFAGSGAFLYVLMMELGVELFLKKLEHPNYLVKGFEISIFNYFLLILNMEHFISKELGRPYIVRQGLYLVDSFQYYEEIEKAKNFEC